MVYGSRYKETVPLRGTFLSSFPCIWDFCTSNHDTLHIAPGVVQDVIRQLKSIAQLKKVVFKDYLFFRNKVL